MFKSPKLTAFPELFLSDLLQLHFHLLRQKLLYIHLGCSQSTPCTNPSAYILCLLPRSAGPPAALLLLLLLLRSRSTVLPRSLALNRGSLAVRWFALVARPRAAGEEPPTEAAFVGCIPAAFDWNPAWTGHVGCL